MVVSYTIQTPKIRKVSPKSENARCVYGKKIEKKMRNEKKKLSLEWKSSVYLRTSWRRPLHSICTVSQC